MTLIIGIKCENSIVLAADGAATLATSAGILTIRQSIKKLEIISGKAILGVSGQVGTGQLYREELQNMINAKKVTSKPIGQAMSTIRDNFRNQVEGNLKLADSLGIKETVYCNAVIAMPVSGKPRLIQFDHLCQPEEATDQLPFISIGSGQGLADPFLAFLRRVFWPTGLPSLAQGSLAAVWTLQHCIEIAPAYVRDPIQVAVLEKSGDSFKARELNDDELDEHSEAATNAEIYLSKIPGTGTPTPDIPQPM